MQRYSKVADWDYVNSCAQISPVPLIGNGGMHLQIYTMALYLYLHNRHLDIYNWEEAVHYLDNTSVSSLMIARSAIIKPWIFTEIKGIKK